jgi:hypothetical protein
MAERDEWIVDLLRKNATFPVIARIVGMDTTAVGRHCRRLIKQHNIDYHPPKRSVDEPVPGLTEASARLRNKLGTRVCHMRDVNGLSSREIAKRTGVPARAQGRATNGSRHDWTISQMERLAEAGNETFKEMLVSSLLTAEDLPMIINRLIPPIRKQSEIHREAVKCSKSLLDILS